MATVALIQKLQDIKNSLGIESFATIHHMLNEAQEVALCIQRETPEQRRRDSRFLHPNIPAER